MPLRPDLADADDARQTAAGSSDRMTAKFDTAAEAQECSARLGEEEIDSEEDEDQYAHSPDKGVYGKEEQSNASEEVHSSLGRDAVGGDGSKPVSNIQHKGLSCSQDVKADSSQRQAQRFSEGTDLIDSSTMLVSRKRKCSGDGGGPSLRFVEPVSCIPPNFEHRRKLPFMKCIVRVGKKQAFGSFHLAQKKKPIGEDFDLTNTFTPYVELDPGPPHAPAITLKIDDPRDSLYYLNRWSTLGCGDEGYFLSNFRTYLVREHPDNKEVYNLDAIKDSGNHWFNDLVCIRFVVWPHIVGFSLGKDSRELKKHVGKSLRTSLAMLRHAQGCFEITIWFISPLSWILLENTVFSFFKSAIMARGPNILHQWRDPDGLSLDMTAAEGARNPIERATLDEDRALERRRSLTASNLAQHSVSAAPSGNGSGSDDDAKSRDEKEIFAADPANEAEDGS